MSAKQRLGFPTKFAKEQNFYEVKDGTKMYLFDQVTQFIYKVSFKLGQVSGDGLDEYVSQSYSSVEKKFKVDNYDILFARRDFKDPNVAANEPVYTWKSQVNANITYSNPSYRYNVDHESYLFLNDQLVYDPQLGTSAYKNKSVLDIQSPGLTYPVTATNHGTQAQNVAKVETFIPYVDQRNLSNSIMKNKAWIRKFAQKHFLMIFRSNNVMEDPRIFYGFPIKDLRYHPYDQVKY